MSRTLVVVACNRDRWNFELLCRSMQKFLQPCKVIFIYNENREHVKTWRKFYQEKCEPLLKEFDVKILVKDNFWSIEDENHLTPPEKEGWVDQQVIKLGVAEHVTTEYFVVLDAKNFFIKKTHINEIAQIAPEPTSWCEPILQNWIVTCCETLTVSVPQKPMRLTQNTTPYIIRTQSAIDLIKYFGGLKCLYKWFTIEARKLKHCAAEFFLYEIFTIRFGYRNLGDNTQNCIAFWEHMHTQQHWRLKDYIKHIDHMYERYDVRVAGLHKGMGPYWNANDLNIILAKLNCADIMPEGNTTFTGEKSYSKR